MKEDISYFTVLSPLLTLMKILGFCVSLAENANRIQMEPENKELCRHRKVNLKRSSECTKKVNISLFTVSQLPLDCVKQTPLEPECNDTLENCTERAQSCEVNSQTSKVNSQTCEVKSQTCEFKPQTCARREFSLSKSKTYTSFFSEKEQTTTCVMNSHYLDCANREFTGHLSKINCVVKETLLDNVNTVANSNSVNNDAKNLVAHAVKSLPSDGPVESNMHTCRLQRIMFRGYCSLALLLLWTTVCAGFSNYWLDKDGNKNFLYYRLSNSLWQAYVVICFTFFYPVSSVKWLANVIRHFDMYRSLANGVGIPQERIETRMKRIVYGAVIVVVIFIITTTIYNLVQIGTPQSDSLVSLKAVIIEPLRKSNLFTILFILLGGYISCISYVLVIFQTALISFLKLQFSALSEFMRAEFEENEIYACTRLETFRHLYMNLCQLTQLVDKKLSWFIGLFTAGSVCVLIFLASSIVNSVSSSNEWRSNVFFLLVNFGSFLITSFLSCSLSEQAKAPLNTLLGLRSVTSCPQQLGELNLWVTSIVHGGTGITALGFFTITKEMILTILGLVVSYFIVINELRLQ